MGKFIELWRWRYRDQESGEICRTPTQLTEAQVAGYQEAERIPGSMTLRQVVREDDPETSFDSPELQQQTQAGPGST